MCDRIGRILAYAFVANAAISGWGGVATDAAPSDWPMFRRNLARTGVSDQGPTSFPLTQQWASTVGSYYWNSYSSPAIVEGVAYFGRTNDQTFYALDAATGATVWQFVATGMFQASPCVSDGVVYIGTMAGRFYALDAVTGAKKWEFVSGGRIHSSACVWDGRVYFGSTNGLVYALDAATGAVVWTFATGGWVYSSPAIAEGVLYVGSRDAKAYALDATTGAKQWEFVTGGPIDAGPCVQNGAVYISSWDGNLYALSTATGTKQWQFPTGGRVFAGCAIADGIVYVPSEARKVFAVNAATGAKVWEYTTGGAAVRGPTVSNGALYVTSWQDKKLHVLDAATGADIWELVAPGEMGCSPVVYQGWVYIQSTDGTVIAYGSSVPANQSPAADAGADQTVEQSYLGGADVTLDGSGSSDPDEDDLTYSWTWDGGSAAGVTPTASFPLGTTTVTLVVSDGQLESEPDEVVITVVDNTTPELTCPDDITVEQQTADGTMVEFECAATDICDGDVHMVCDPPSGSVFPLGETIVTCTATDDSGNQAQCTFTVTVVDTTPPEFESADAEPDVLWPPNHKMVEVEVFAALIDVCDAEPAYAIISVTSNEPVNGKGDGNTALDWEITGDHTVKLRAERSGQGDGRIYTITVLAVDDSGNTSTTEAQVTVPHDQGSKGKGDKQREGKGKSKEKGKGKGKK